MNRRGPRPPRRDAALHRETTITQRRAPPRNAAAASALERAQAERPGDPEEKRHCLAALPHRRGGRCHDRRADPRQRRGAAGGGVQRGPGFGGGRHRLRAGPDDGLRLPRGWGRPAGPGGHPGRRDRRASSTPALQRRGPAQRHQDRPARGRHQNERPIHRRLPAPGRQLGDGPGRVDGAATRGAGPRWGPAPSPRQPTGLSWAGTVERGGRLPRLAPTRRARHPPARGRIPRTARSREPPTLALRRSWR